MREVPFFSNTTDDTHCVQAVFRMALKYCLPDLDFSWRQLDDISHKQPGLGTWWFPAVAKLRELGLEIAYIDRFDYSKFLEQGKPYLDEFYGTEIADWFVNKSNLLHVKKTHTKIFKGTRDRNEGCDASGY